jgi:acyl carrier protein
MTTLSDADVRAVLKQVLKNDAPDGWALDYNFLDGEIDSLDHATMALLLEEKFGLKISDDDLRGLSTIAKVQKFAQETS